MAPRARRLRYIRPYERQLDAPNATRRENEPARAGCTGRRWAVRGQQLPGCSLRSRKERLPAAKLALSYYLSYTKTSSFSWGRAAKKSGRSALTRTGGTKTMFSEKGGSSSSHTARAAARCVQGAPWGAVEQQSDAGCTGTRGVGGPPSPPGRFGQTRR